jgi:hypothetical protein
MQASRLRGMCPSPTRKSGSDRPCQHHPLCRVIARTVVSKSSGMSSVRFRRGRASPIRPTQELNMSITTVNLTNNQILSANQRVTWRSPERRCDDVDLVADDLEPLEISDSEETEVSTLLPADGRAVGDYYQP